MNVIYIGALLFIAGCYAGLRVFALAGWSLYLFAGVLLVLAFAALCRTREKWLPAIAGLFFLLLGLGAGSLAPPPPQQVLSGCYGHAVSFSGSVDPLSVRQSDVGTSFIVAIDDLSVNGRSVVYHDKLRVFTAAKNLPAAGVVTGQGILNELSSFRNPGSFDSTTWNHVNGIGGRVSKAQVRVVSSELTLLEKIALLNTKLRQKLTDVLGKERGALLGGMVLGGSGVDSEVRELFAANGLSHLLSVSGTHMVLLAGFLSLLLGRLPRKIKAIIIIALLGFYAVLCGLRPPVLRAFIMSSVLLGGGLWSDKGSAERGNLLCLTAVGMLLVKPLWLLDIGFQLSFGAAAGLLWLLPSVQRRTSAVLPDVISDMAAVTIAAQLAILPLLVGYFYTLPLISIISNILLVPVLEICAGLTVIGVGISSIASAGDYVLLGAGFLTTQVLHQAAWLAELPYVNVVIGSLPVWCAVVYYFLLAVALDLPCVQIFSVRERQGAMLTLCAVLTGAWCWQQFAPQPLTAYFLDVGQGDCSVVVTPDRQVIVIDTGGLKNYDTGSNIVAPFLYSMGVDKIDALVISHGDNDHAGGAAGLARKVQIGKVILPKEKYSDAERKLLKQIDSSKAVTAAMGQGFNFGDVQLQILAAPYEQASGNEASIVCSVTDGRSRLLYTGDIDEVREGMLGHIGSHDVLKVAHHGSRYSSSYPFLQQVQPQLAVISSGRGNGYGHPHDEAVERLAAIGSRVLRTDELGAIKVTFDAEGARWYSYVYSPNGF